MPTISTQIVFLNGFGSDSQWNPPQDGQGREVHVRIIDLSRQEALLDRLGKFHGIRLPQNEKVIGFFAG